MQFEARRVQLENRVLRRMLSERGVGEPAIHERIRAEPQLAQREGGVDTRRVG